MRKRASQRPPEQRVLQFISENGLVAEGQPLLVAVSGGPDSVCLLHILARLQQRLGARLHVAHLDHRLRGAESEADAEYVRRLATGLGLPVTIGSCDVRSYRAERRLTLEEAAREARYNFLAETAACIGAASVAVGHTSDDHIETILMHLIRGTGARGLRGLRPVSGWKAAGHCITVIRPLLPLSREETAEYCRLHNLQTCLDSSNESLSPLRNRIRHQLVPLLESYNPAIKEGLARTARLTGDDLALLNRESARLGTGVARKEAEAIILDKEGFLALPPGLKRHLLREAIGDLLGDLKDIEARHIDGIIDMAGKPAGRRMSLPGGLAFIIEYDRFLLALEQSVPSPLPPLEGECVLKIPGETLFSGWRITSTIIRQEEVKNPGNRFTAYLDSEAAGRDLTVRSRRTGDTFQPLGLGMPKELTEFMIDAKIPRAWRERVPIVCSPRHILWVVGWRIDERARVTPDGRSMLQLRFERCQ